jgi:hypothetical protein
MDLKWRIIILETIGEASMLWSETPRGVFESGKAFELGERIINQIEAAQSAEIKRLEGELLPMIEAWDFIRENGQLIECDCMVADDDDRWGNVPEGIKPESVYFCADKNCSGIWVGGDPDVARPNPHSDNCLFRKANKITDDFLARHKEV